MYCCWFRAPFVVATVARRSADGDAATAPSEADNTPPPTDRRPLTPGGRGTVYIIAFSPLNTPLNTTYTAVHSTRSGYCMI